MFFAFASLSVSFTVALCLWGPLAWILCDWSVGGYDVEVLKVGGKKGREQFTRLFDF